MRAAIVEVEGSASTMANDLSRLVGLAEAVPSILPLLEDVDGTVLRLADVMEPLQGATLRFGRLADRLPRRAATDGRSQNGGPANGQPASRGPADGTPTEGAPTADR